MDNINEHNILAILSGLMNTTEVGIYVSDYHTCEILFVNRTMADYVGIANTRDLIGQPCWMLVNPNKNGRCKFCPYEKLLDDAGHPTEPYSWEFNVPNAGLWIKSINRALFWSDGRLAQMVTFYDISEMKNMQQQLANLAYRDRLLKLKNEISLENDMQQASEKPSLIVFDITSLQKVNDAHGRGVGDCLLYAIKTWITEQYSKDSELYRIGGDEFCLTIKNHDSNQLKMLADVLLQRFKQPWILEYNGKKIQIYCNVIAAIIIGSYILEDEPLISLIERTLKTAKHKRSITVYDELMDRNYKQHLQFELCLKRAVHDGMDGFDVYFQPITNAESKHWCGLEALCRWNSSMFGWVNPSHFIAEAERLELIDSIGLWVMEKAVAQCKNWGLDKHNGFLLDVNISAAQFSNIDLADDVLAILKKYDYPGQCLCVEITESTRFTFVEHSLDTINRLRADNIMVALDDFGTGYSNFHHIKDLPADIVKIERAFTKNIEQDAFQRYLFHAMSELAHTANMKLIAEGVESKTQMEILLNSGADYLQGYLFSRPLSAKDLQNKLFCFRSSG